MSIEAEIARLAAAIPRPVFEVCRRLTEAGFEAVTVGGAVRDAILGRPIGDWDVATSAHPDEVIALFSRTIPTGIQHGTVTVVLGRGAEREAVEVTTFRGEGAYTDARRPDTVTFGVPLHEDLARRDLVINAMAYDPINQTLHDPFGGHADLARRVIRAVGDPGERFAEDGLRVMRAVRFAATLEFDLDPATEAAIPGALPSLAKVSAERVRVELVKLMQAPDPAPALEIAWRTGIVGVITPELDPGDDPEAIARWQQALSRVSALDGLHERLAVWMATAMPQRGEARFRVADAMLRRLTFSNADRERAVRLIRYFDAWRGGPFGDADLRRLLGQVGREHCDELIRVWRAQDAGAAGERLFERAAEILARNDPLVVGDLAIGGAEVIAEVGEAGPVVGQILRRLLAAVLEDPALNTPPELRSRIRELARELTSR